MATSPTVRPLTLEAADLPALSQFINGHHDKIICTANRAGEPNASLMGTPRLTVDGLIQFEISDRASTTLDNLRQNPEILLMAYRPGARARDYYGARVSARVSALHTDGEVFESIRSAIAAQFGDVRAAELRATVTCTITRVRAVVDRGQAWNDTSFDE